MIIVIIKILSCTLLSVTHTPSLSIVERVLSQVQVLSSPKTPPEDKGKSEKNNQMEYCTSTSSTSRTSSTSIHTTRCGKKKKIKKLSRVTLTITPKEKKLTHVKKKIINRPQVCPPQKNK